MLSIFTMQVYASPDEKPNENLIVNAAWLDDELLRLDVTDIETGINSSLALRLSDIISESDNSPYLLIQAVDFGGNQSSIIQIKNPFYVQPGSENTAIAEVKEENQSESVSAIPITPHSNLNPFTPTGTGTVVDNATDGDGKEFLTIFTEDGNEFFLIIDRHRNSDNVYLLNTVTEEDLMSMADRAGRNIENTSTVSTIPITPPQGTTEGQSQPTETQPTPEPEAPPTPNRNSNNNNLIIILIVVAAVGGAAYYFKIVKGRNQSSMQDDEDEDDGKEYEFENEPDEDGGDDVYDTSDEGGDSDEK